jgi:hypothetical protein
LVLCGIKISSAIARGVIRQATIVCEIVVRICGPIVVTCCIGRIEGVSPIISCSIHIIRAAIIGRVCGIITLANRGTIIIASVICCNGAICIVALCE